MLRRREPSTPATKTDLPPGRRDIGCLRHSPCYDQRLDSQVQALKRYIAVRSWVLVNPWWADGFRERSTDGREESHASAVYAGHEPPPTKRSLPGFPGGSFTPPCSLTPP